MGHGSEGQAAELASERDRQLRSRRLVGRGDVLGREDLPLHVTGPLYGLFPHSEPGLYVCPDPAEFDGCDPDALIRAQQQQCSELGASADWFLPDGLAPGVPERLREGGIGGRQHDQESVMVGRATDVLAVRTSLPHLPDGIRLREAATVDDFVQVRDLTETVRGNNWQWGPEALARWGDDPDNPCVTIVAETPDGEIVATVWVRFHTGTDFASVWGASTQKSWRSRGLYRSLTVYRAALAHERGYSFLYGEALRTSSPILSGLGLLVARTQTPYRFDPRSTLE